MKPLALFIAAVVGVTLTSESVAQKKRFRSATANVASLEFTRSVARARTEFNKKVEAARKKFLRALDKSMRSATKSADLKEANKLKAYSDALKKIDLKPAQTPDKLVGTWHIQFGLADGLREYRFRADGSITVVIDKKPKTGRLIRRGKTLFIDMGDRWVRRLSVVGDRLFIEHSLGQKKRFADAVGSGFRVK